MVEPREHLVFAFEGLHELPAASGFRSEPLQRHLIAGRSVADAVNDAHPAGGEHLLDHVTTGDAGPDHASGRAAGAPHIDPIVADYH